MSEYPSKYTTDPAKRRTGKSPFLRKLEKAQKPKAKKPKVEEKVLRFPVSSR